MTRIYNYIHVHTRNVMHWIHTCKNTYASIYMNIMIVRISEVSSVIMHCADMYRLKGQRRFLHYRRSSHLDVTSAPYIHSTVS